MLLNNNSNIHKTLNFADIFINYIGKNQRMRVLPIITMENSKKLILLTLLLLIISCKKNLKECQNCETNKDSLIFVDKGLNEIYFRTKAIERHPKLEKSLHANNYYVFYNKVNIYSLNKEVSLKEIINLESFRKINHNYFEDNEFIYFIPQNPIGNYFNILDKKENIKFSKNQDTIYSRYGIFYKGNLITQNTLHKNKTTPFVALSPYICHRNF